MSLRDNKSKHNDLFNKRKVSKLLDKLEIDSLINTNLLDITDYKNNLDYFKEIVFSKKDSNLTRMWLIHLLGGHASANHFFNHNGTLKSDSKIHEQLLRLLSWRGTEINDFWMYQKISKRFSKLWAQLFLASSYFKEITHFIKTFISRFFQIFNINKHFLNQSDLKTKFNLVLSSSLGLSSFILNNETKNILEKVFDFSNKYQIGEQESLLKKFLQKTNTSIKIFLISNLIISLFIACYESYYYQIERDHLRKYLSQGLSDYHRTQISKFKVLYFEFENAIQELVKKDDSELIFLIDKFYDKNFRNNLGYFLKREDTLKELLKRNLTQDKNISLFYLEIKKKQCLYPLAIYFFNQNGSPRTVRESICSIIQGLKNISSKSMKILHEISIISKRRQLNLTKTNKISPSKKLTIKKVRKRNIL